MRLKFPYGNIRGYYLQGISGNFRELHEFSPPYSPPSRNSCSVRRKTGVTNRLLNKKNHNDSNEIGGTYVGGIPPGFAHPEIVRDPPMAVPFTL